MALRFIDKSALNGSDRHVENEVYETHRFLLAEDGLNITITDILLHPGIERIYGYDDHVEIAYCIEGAAIIRDHASSLETHINPGMMWIAEKGDRFSFRAEVSTRLICAFTPPFSGSETGFAGDQ